MIILIQVMNHLTGLLLRSNTNLAAPDPEISYLPHVLQITSKPSGI